MATIGQAFSPGFLSLLTQKNEGAKNRGLQAALGDRQLKLQEKQANAGIAQQNIDNQFRAEQAAVQGSNSRQQIELLKEEGRNSRSERSNALKQALAESGLAIKEGEAASRQALRGASIEKKTLESMLASSTLESNTQKAAADAALAEARGDTEGARKASFAASAALNRERAEDMDKTRESRIKAMKAQADNYHSMIADRGVRQAFQKAQAEFNNAMKEKNFKVSVVKMQAALEKYQTQVNIYGQSLFDRANSGDPAAVAAVKNGPVQMAVLNDLMNSMGAQLDNALKTGSHSPNRRAKGAAGGQKAKSSVGADAGDLPGLDR